MDAERKELKYVGFLRFAALQSILIASSLYDYAKRNSGPLRSIVDSVEGTVAKIVSPVYDKFKNVPYHVLVFVDDKVDEGAQTFNKHAPPVAKQVVSQAQSLIEKASEKAKKLVHQVQVGGTGAGLCYAASEYKLFVLILLAKMWVGAEKLPPFHAVAEKVVPTAAHCSDKYNKTVVDLSAKGYPVFGYLPLVPVDEMVKTYKVEKAAKGGIEHKPEEDSSSSDSDRE